MKKILITSLLMFLYCTNNPYDPANIKSSFRLPIRIQSITTNVDAYSFFPVSISFIPEHPEFIDSIKVYSGSIGILTSSDSVTLKNGQYTCIFAYPDSGTFHPTARIFVANNNNDRFDTVFSVNIGLDIKPEPVLGFKGDTTKLIAHGTKPNATFWQWTYPNGQLIAKSIKDTAYGVFSSMYDSTINVFICDSLGRLSSPVKTHASISAHYNFTISSTGNGKCTPAGVVKIKHGDSVAVHMLPDSNYKVTQILYDGLEQPLTNPFKNLNITSDHTLNVAYAIKGTFRVVTYKYGQGDITPSTSFYVNYGSDTTLHFTPARNFKLDSIVSDAVNIGNNTSFTLRSITKDTYLSAYFGQIDTLHPIISNVYPTDSMLVSQYKIGYELNKFMQSMEVRLIATPYGTNDPLSPHIIKPDSLSRIAGIHVLTPQKDSLVSGGIYDLTFTGCDSLGVASNIVKIYKVRIQ